jgi:hypothetical protein
MVYGLSLVYANFLCDLFVGMGEMCYFCDSYV